MTPAQSPAPPRAQRRFARQSRECARHPSRPLRWSAGCCRLFTTTRRRFNLCRAIRKGIRFSAAFQLRARATFSECSRMARASSGAPSPVLRTTQKCCRPQVRALTPPARPVARTRACLRAGNQSCSAPAARGFFRIRRPPVRGWSSEVRGAARAPAAASATSTSRLTDCRWRVKPQPSPAPCEEFSVSAGVSATTAPRSLSERETKPSCGAVVVKGILRHFGAGGGDCAQQRGFSAVWRAAQGDLGGQLKLQFKAAGFARLAGGAAARRAIGGGLNRALPIPPRPPCARTALSPGAFKTAWTLPVSASMMRAPRGSFRTASSRLRRACLRRRRVRRPERGFRAVRAGRRKS